MLPVSPRCPFLIYLTFIRVLRYQRGNHNRYIEEQQATQWSKEKGQKDKQWSTKHTHKSKDRETRTPFKILQFEQDEHKLLLEEI